MNTCLWICCKLLEPFKIWSLKITGENKITLWNAKYYLLLTQLNWNFSMTGTVLFVYLDGETFPSRICWTYHRIFQIIKMFSKSYIKMSILLKSECSLQSKIRIGMCHIAYAYLIRIHFSIEIFVSNQIIRNWLLIIK